MSIDLVLSETELSVGGALRGTVKVLAQPARRAKALCVYFQCSGNRLPTTVFARLDLAQQGPYEDEYPFELALPPDAPFSFDEEPVSINWAVCAKIEVPFGRDVSKRYKITVHPGAPKNDLDVKELAALLPEPNKAASGTGQKVLKVALWTLFSPVALVLSPIVAVVYARKAWTKTSVHKFRFSVPDNHLALGQHVVVSVEFQLKKPVHVEELVVALKGVQTWTTGSGNNRSTKTHVFFESRSVVLKDQAIEPGPDVGDYPEEAYRSRSRQPRPQGPVFVGQSVLSLPQDGAPTLGRGLAYQVSTALKLRGVPDLFETARLNVLGARLVEVLEPPRPRSFSETSGALNFPSA